MVNYQKEYENACKRVEAKIRIMKLRARLLEMDGREGRAATLRTVADNCSRMYAHAPEEWQKCKTDRDRKGHIDALRRLAAPYN